MRKMMIEKMMRTSVLLLATTYLAFVPATRCFADTAQPVLETVTAAENHYDEIAVSQVSGYVNVRSEASTAGAIVGKIYNNCAATILDTVTNSDGTWYQIRSGSVTGYIKASYFIAGGQAEKLAEHLQCKFVNISASGLRLRAEASLNSNVLTYLNQNEHYLMLSESGDFYEIEVDNDLHGFVAKSFCRVTIEFDTAVSLEEEAAQLAKRQQLEENAETAIAAFQSVQEEYRPDQSDTGAGSAWDVQGNGQGSAQGGSDTVETIEPNPFGQDDDVSVGAPPVQQEQPDPSNTSTSLDPSTGSQQQGNPTVSSGPVTGQSDLSSAGPGVAGHIANAAMPALRTAIVAYAKQFLGNPYVWGGTSLTEGADCSGFVMKIYEYFGIAIKRTSREQATCGREISYSEMMPGDLVFYASEGTINHVALYIGNGQIIHASGKKTGIILSAYDYRTPEKAVRIFE